LPIIFSIGGRTSGDIVTWVEMKSGPPAPVLNSQEELLELAKKGVIVVGYFKVILVFSGIICVHYGSLSWTQLLA